MEMIPVKQQIIVGSYSNIFDSATLIWIALYFQVISKNWVWYQIFGLALIAASTIGCVMLPESPKFLYEKKRYDEARKVFEKIAKFNRKQFNAEFMFDTEQQEQQAKIGNTHSKSKIMD